MIRSKAPFYGKRFVGDSSKNIVHDQLFEQTDCRIDEIKDECVRTFSPDTLEKAKAENYKPCKQCLRFDYPNPDVLL
jgi:hypothetical protein